MFWRQLPRCLCYRWLISNSHTINNILLFEDVSKWSHQSKINLRNKWKFGHSVTLGEQRYMSTRRHCYEVVISCSAVLLCVCSLCNRRLLDNNTSSKFLLVSTVSLITFTAVIFGWGCLVELICAEMKAMPNWFRLLWKILILKLLLCFTLAW